MNTRVRRKAGNWTVRAVSVVFHVPDNTQIYVAFRALVRSHPHLEDRFEVQNPWEVAKEASEAANETHDAKLHPRDATTVLIACCSPTARGVISIGLVQDGDELVDIQAHHLQGPPKKVFV